jgi:short-subunit dehydrogenase
MRGGHSDRCRHRSERRGRAGDALEFARRGCDVALLARNATRLEAAAGELCDHAIKALSIVGDVADARAVEAAATGILETPEPVVTHCVN